MVTCYTLFSHTDVFLAAQVELLRRHVRDLGRIVVVEGPYGADPTTAGGDLCVPDSAAHALGVEILEISESFAGHPWGIRIPKIYDYLLGIIRDQSEEHALILHGDCLPTRPIDVAELLDGHQAALRGTDERIAYTWLACTRDPGDLQHARRWPAHDLDASAAALFPGYLPAWRFELCEPGWLHLDQMCHRPHWAQEKLAVVTGPLGISAPPIVAQRMTGLRQHRIPFYGPRPQAVAPEPVITYSGLPDPIIRRLGICHRCNARPEGCWRAREYTCTIVYTDAARLAASTNNCPLGKLDG